MTGEDARRYITDEKEVASIELCVNVVSPNVTGEDARCYITDEKEGASIELCVNVVSPNVTGEDARRYIDRNAPRSRWLFWI